MHSHRRLKMTVLSAVLALGLVAPGVAQTDEAAAEHPGLGVFVQAANPDPVKADAALQQLAGSWKDGYAAMLIDMMRLMPGSSPRRRAGGTDAGSMESGAGSSGGPSGGGVDTATAQRGTPGSGGGGGPGGPGGQPASPIRLRLAGFLEQQTGNKFGDDLDRWRHWLWSKEYEPHPDYPVFKGGLYGNIDRGFREFFPPGVTTKIRLDQIDWGGVRVNGVPLLDHPKHVSARAAGYLKDKNVVFGIVVNGEARAYPKRILAWHELARDRLGDVELAIVYCTLCGTVIPYDSQAGGQQYTFGTSGLLYRSNKLMFDEETDSLWSTVYGKPVVGPLAQTQLQLTSYPVVTTTWGEWKAVHPDTTVLSIPTDFDKDYREGAAYKEYFKHDRLMFAVPETDKRLKNKAEVLVLPHTTRDPAAGPPLAIAAALLGKQKLMELEHGGKRLLVLTSAGGANRVYDVGDQSFKSWLDGRHVEDAAGGSWTVTEEALIADNDQGGSLPRLPAHRAFWFGWYAAHPDTKLVK